MTSENGRGYVYALTDIFAGFAWFSHLSKFYGHLFDNLALQVISRRLTWMSRHTLGFVLNVRSAAPALRKISLYLG